MVKKVKALRLLADTNYNVRVAQYLGLQEVGLAADGEPYINPHLENIPEARYHVTGRYDIS